MSLQARFKKPKPATAPAASANADGSLPRFLTLQQSAAYLGLPLSQLRILVRAHTIKRIPERTHRFLVAKEELDRYAAEQVRNSF